MKNLYKKYTYYFKIMHMYLLEKKVVIQKVFSYSILMLYSYSCIANTSFTGNENKAKHSLPFKPGEKLEYKINYGLINAGTATLKIDPEVKKIQGKNVYHAIGEGKSNSFFDFFYKVRDRYESYIDKDSIRAVKFVRRVDEGGYKINQDYTFYTEKSIVDNGAGKRYSLPIKQVQDMISAFYYARTMDYSKANIGDIFTIPTFVDNELWYLKMKYMGTDTVKVDKGKFSCLKFVPVVQKGRIFKAEEDLMVYITNDKNKIPVLAEAKVLVGSIRMDLINFEGLAHPVAQVSK